MCEKREGFSETPDLGNRLGKPGRAGWRERESHIQMGEGCNSWMVENAQLEISGITNGRGEEPRQGMQEWVQPNFQVEHDRCRCGGGGQWEH